MFLDKKELKYYKAELRKRYDNLIEIIDNGKLEGYEENGSWFIDSGVAFLAARDMVSILLVIQKRTKEKY